VIDLALAQRLLEVAVGPVVTELCNLEPELPPVMVVGAACRDALHAAAGHAHPLRRTDDLDIAVAVNGWDHFNTLTAQLAAVAGASSTIRYRVAGHTVDIVPFGEPVESPDGIVSPSRRGEAMSVFGFQDVWQSAYEVEVSAPRPVRVPTVAGYTVLKLKAWADRSAHDEHKDGGDLAIAMHWYQEDDELLAQRIWGGDDAGITLLSESDFSLPEAAVRLLIGDARAVLSPARQEELTTVWRDLVADDRLAEHLHNGLLPGWPPRGDKRLTDYARAVRQTLLVGTASVQPL
jgi:predicted nucleotidyltransferase